MLLYYSPGACSQAPHILLHELGLGHDSKRVDLKSKTVEDGSSFLNVNSKGSVPALRLDDGEVLTENAVILQFLGDQAHSQMLPSVGDFQRYRVLEWVNYITTELHKSFSPLFKTDAGDEVKSFFRNAIAQRFDYVDRKLGNGPFLMGETMTIADILAVHCLNWARVAKFPLSNAAMVDYAKTMSARPAYVKARERGM